MDYFLVIRSETRKGRLGGPVQTRSSSLFPPLLKILFLFTTGVDINNVPGGKIHVYMHSFASCRSTSQYADDPVTTHGARSREAPS
ncbi:uncharacterized protein J3R85_001140 [Psidium guajava]|nr:uncharacterized protein J3R85_001140 [Psidium guajava]